MNKLYKLFFVFTISLVLTSCEDSIKCDGFLEIQTLKEILKEDLLKPEKKFTYQMLGIEDMESYLEHFFRDNVALDLIRTTDIKKEIKKCDCAAKLMFNLDPKIKEFLENQTKGDSFRQLMGSALLAKEGIDIEYSIQETNNDEFIVETYLIDELSQIVGAYYMIEKSYKEMNDKTEFEEVDDIEEYESEEITETQNILNSSEFPKEGIINGTDVVFRDNHSTQSNIIGSFKNKGESVILIEKFVANNENQGLITNDLNIMINNTSYELKKDKAIKILNRSGENITISFIDENGMSHTKQVNENSVTEIQNDIWYKVKRHNEKTGWVFGKFVTVE